MLSTHGIYTCCLEELAKLFNNTVALQPDDHAQVHSGRLLNIFSAIFLTVLNLVLIKGLICTTKKGDSKLKKRINALYIYLSVTDLLVGMVVIPYYLALDLFSVHGCIYRHFGSMLVKLSMFLGMGALFWISLLRYLSIAKPFLKISNRKLMSFLMLNMAVALSIAIWYVCDFTYIYDNKNPIFIELLMWSLVVVFCVNATLLINALSKFAISRNTEFAPKSCRSHSGRAKSAVNTLVLLSCAYGVCYFPPALYWMVTAIYFIQGDYNNGFNVLMKYEWLQYLILLNSGLNTLIYIWKSKEIVKHYKGIFCASSKSNERKRSIRMSEDTTSKSPAAKTSASSSTTEGGNGGFNADSTLC